MLSLIVALALGSAGRLEVATGLSAYAAVAAGSEFALDLDEIGEPFTVYRQDKNVRVEIGKDLVVLCIKGDEFVVADLKRKVGARYVEKSERFPKGERISDGYSFPRYMVHMFFPLWPDSVPLMASGSPTKAEFDKWATGLELKSQDFAHPTWGDVRSYSKQLDDRLYAWQMPTDWGKSPRVVMWSLTRPKEYRIMVYTEPWRSQDAKPELFAVPAGVRIEDSPSFDKTDWKVFKDFDAFIEWRDPMTAEDRKPRKQ
jgi:hypothetical protein